MWVAPPLALQRAVAGDLLRARRHDRLVLGLPLEELLFFVLVTLLVVDGLVLATDGEALRRARRRTVPSWTRT